MEILLRSSEEDDDEYLTREGSSQREHEVNGRAVFPTRYWLAARLIHRSASRPRRPVAAFSIASSGGGSSGSKATVVALFEAALLPLRRAQGEAQCRPLPPRAPPPLLRSSSGNPS
ncbi:uncharacterized protein A4U43_UnF5560 [Asparagus officinalis]|uniref:Uncharacterized protein n=1 Tax=Asparagus officinalis TaxID=4686 RepID=A0A1R3L6P0_ASPOF|nr:uncharacterized protein A4U43_UnF5560 [Asparagus officinalis]